MKTILIATALMLITATAYADCVIDSKCNPEKYGGQRSTPNVSYTYSYSYYTYSNPRPNLEQKLYNQGRRISGY